MPSNLEIGNGKQNTTRDSPRQGPDLERLASLSTTYLADSFTKNRFLDGRGTHTFFTSIQTNSDQFRSVHECSPLT